MLKKIFLAGIFLVILVIYSGAEKVRADDYSCSGTGWCHNNTTGVSTPFDCARGRSAQNCSDWANQVCDSQGNPIQWDVEAGCNQTVYCMPVGGQINQGCAANGCAVGTERICTCQAAGNYTCNCYDQPSCPQPTPVPGCGSCGGCSPPCGGSCQGTCSDNGQACTINGPACGGPTATPAVTDNAACVSNTIPLAMSPGQVVPVSVTMNNNGPTTWLQSAVYRLGAQDPQDNMNWGLNRVTLPVASVGPGGNVTFNFNMTAPTTPGTYNGHWKMVHDGVAWFGATCGPTVTVGNCVDVCQSMSYLGGGCNYAGGCSHVLPGGVVTDPNQCVNRIVQLWTTAADCTGNTCGCYQGTVNNCGYPANCDAVTCACLPNTGSGVIQGRIQSNGAVTKCPGCTYGGAAQCENALSFDKQVTISGVGSFKVTNCNGGGPYYVTNVAAGSTRLVSVNLTGGEAATYQCSLDLGGGVNGCPNGVNGSGAGGAINVAVANGQTYSVWFNVFIAPTLTPTPIPVCTISVPATMSMGTNSTATLNVTVNSQSGGTVDRLTFSSSAGRVSVTTPDTSAPFSSTLTSNANPGNAVVTANAYMSGNTTTIRCSDTSTVTVVAPTPTPTSPAPTATRTPTPTIVPNCVVTIPTPAFTLSKCAPGTANWPVTVGPTGGAVQQVNFATSNSNTATVVSPDSTSPYSTTVTAITPNPTPATLTALCVIGGVTRGSGTGTVTVVACPTSTPTSTPTRTPTPTTTPVLSPTPTVAAWWQVQGGGNATAANGTVQSQVPSLPIQQYACEVTTAPVCAVVAGRSFIGFDQSIWVSANPKYYVADPGGNYVDRAGLFNKYNYDAMLARIRSAVNPTTVSGPTTINLTDAYVDTLALNSGARWLWVTGNGVTNISGNVSTRKVVILVNDRVNFPAGVGVSTHSSGGVVVISKGNMTVDGGVTQLEGIYMTDGTFDTGSAPPNIQLRVNGTVVAWGGFILARNSTDNRTIPAEIFNFDPDFVANLPEPVKRRHVIQELENP